MTVPEAHRGAGVNDPDAVERPALLYAVLLVAFALAGLGNAAAGRIRPRGAPT